MEEEDEEEEGGEEEVRFILTGVWCRQLTDEPYVTCQAGDNLEGWQEDLKGKSHQTNRCSYPQVLFLFF